LFLKAILDSDKNNQQFKNQESNPIDRSPSPKDSKVPTQHQQIPNSQMGSSNQKQKPQQEHPFPPPPPPSQQQQQQQQHKSSFIHPTPETATTTEFQTPIQSKLPKTSQEKIDDISTRLYNLENDVNSYDSPKDHKKDKAFLLLEESLTQCLLRLDEIDRDDDKINQLRRKLIKTTQRIIEILESKLSNNENTVIHKKDDISNKESNDISDNKSQENLKKEDVDSKNLS
jgi:hypothetical protein